MLAKEVEDVERGMREMEQAWEMGRRVVGMGRKIHMDSVKRKRRKKMKKHKLKKRRRVSVSLSLSLLCN